MIWVLYGSLSLDEEGRDGENDAMNTFHCEELIKECRNVKVHPVNRLMKLSLFPTEMENSSRTQ